MCVEAFQNGCKEAWTHVEPYAVPITIAVGTTFIVGQVWGAMPALCFAGVATGISVGFPQIIKQISKADMLVSIVRIVLTVVLPFFGPWGIAISVGASVFSMFAQDFRLYSIRDKIAQSDAILSELQRRGDERDRARQAMVKECTEKNTSAEAFWNSLPPVDQAVNQAIEAFEKKIQSALDALKKICSDQGVEEREQIVQTILDDIAILKGAI